MSLELTPSNS